MTDLELNAESTDALFQRAKAKIESLKKERRGREDNNHPDPRVPGEITTVLAHLGRRRARMIDSNESMRKTIASNEKNLADMVPLIEALADELGVALKLGDAPDSPPPWNRI